MQHKYFLLWIFCTLLHWHTSAQTIYTLHKEIRGKIDSCDVLPDKNYTFEQIRADKSLPFKQSKYLKSYKDVSHYWLRFVVKNPYPHTQLYYLFIYPMFENELYYYDREKAQWQSKKDGLAVYTPNRQTNQILCAFEGNKQDTFYVKTTVSYLSNQPYTPYADIQLRQADSYIEGEQFLWTMWVATVVVMLAFFMYNLYIYFIFKDVTYLYYLVIVAGGLLYITGLNHYINILSQARLLRFYLGSQGELWWFNLNELFHEIGILGVIWGFIQFSRSYLQTNYWLPYWDKVLQYVALGFIFWMCSTLTITVSGVAYLEMYSGLVENILVACIVLLLLLMGVLVYLKGYIPARYFLIANTIPLLFILSLAIYFVLYEFYNKSVRLLPSMAITSQAVSLAVALVARVNMLREELKQKQTEAQLLQNENEKMVLRNQFIELENEYIMSEMALEKNEKEELKAKLESNQRELNSNTLYLYQKHEMLIDLQKRIERLSQQSSSQQKEVIREIRSTIQNNLQLDADWDKFKLHFEQVHPNFFQELQEKHPNLNQQDMRLLAYLHLNMTAKEIATMLNIEAKSVYKAKTRLNRKMGIEND